MRADSSRKGRRRSRVSGALVLTLSVASLSVLDAGIAPSTALAAPFTVTNTNDFADRTGWGFSNTLPAGPTVAGTPTTTCAAGMITAPHGGTAIGLTNGDIAAGVGSCTVTVPGTSATRGSYLDATSNATTTPLTGLDQPNDAQLTGLTPPPFTEAANPDIIAAGQPSFLSALGLPSGATGTVTFTSGATPLSPRRCPAPPARRPPLCLPAPTQSPPPTAATDPTVPESRPVQLCWS